MPFVVDRDSGHDTFVRGPEVRFFREEDRFFRPEAGFCPEEDRF